MAISTSELRQNIYRLLDEVLETGVALEIERNGRLLRVVADPVPEKLAALDPHPGAVTGDVEDLATLSFADSWTP